MPRAEHNCTPVLVSTGLPGAPEGRVPLPLPSPLQAAFLLPQCLKPGHTATEYAICVGATPLAHTPTPGSPWTPRQWLLRPHQPPPPQPFQPVSVFTLRMAPNKCCPWRPGLESAVSVVGAMVLLGEALFPTHTDTHPSCVDPHTREDPPLLQAVVRRGLSCHYFSQDGGFLGAPLNYARATPTIARTQCSSLVWGALVPPANAVWQEAGRQEAMQGQRLESGPPMYQAFGPPQDSHFFRVFQSFQRARWDRRESPLIQFMYLGKWKPRGGRGPP